MSQTVLPDMGPRLEAASAAVRDARDALQLRIEAFHELIVTAVDEGMSQRAVARHAGVSQPHVNRLLTNSQPDAVLPR